MIKVFYIVVGLPGSGKTTFLKSVDGAVFDDCVNFTRVKSKIKEDIIYIAHPMLCLKKHLDSLVVDIMDKYPDSKINFIYFENNPKKCIKNIKNREKNVIPTIKLLSKKYFIPEGVDVVLIKS